VSFEHVTSDRYIVEIKTFPLPTKPLVLDLDIWSKEREGEEAMEGSP